MRDDAEFMDIVNEDDEVVGRDTRANVHAQHQIHRGVHVFVVNSRGELLLQKRAPDAGSYPGYWDASVGGQVAAGESYEQAARRELSEELGLEVDEFVFVGKYDSYSDRQREKRALFTYESDGPFFPDPHEISALEFIEPHDLEDLDSERRYTGVRSVTSDVAWMASDAKPLAGHGAARVVVVGSVNRDIVVTAPRRPAVGETLMGWELGHYPGGKGANQAVAAARARAATVFVGCVGDDDAGAELRGYLAGAGVDVEHLRVVDQQTGHALITIVDGDNSVIVIAGANSAVSPEDVLRLDLSPADIVVGQFEVPTQTVAALVEHGKARGATTIINPSPARETPPGFWDLCDIIVLNELELEWLQQAIGEGPSDETREKSATRLLRRPDQAIVMTLGPEGCVVVQKSGTTAIRGHRVDPVDTTGAGDCFLGNLAGQLAAGTTLVEAAAVANKAAALCVQRMGASSSMPTIEETLVAFGVRSP